MDILIQIIIFAVSLAVIVKGSDWFLDGAEKVGIQLGLSAFVVGVLIVGLGTSLPELVSSLAAVLQGVPEVVVANAVGSNIANILLVIGLATLVARPLSVSKNLIDSELPMLAISTVVFLVVVYDKSVSIVEALFLIVAYIIYIAYTIHNGEGDESRKQSEQPFKFANLVFIKDILKLIAGGAGLILGSKFLIDSVVSLSEITGLAVGVISISAIALGTSLPEVMVSVRAALAGKAEVAVGNIFGSNAFNALMVVGIPGVFIKTSSLPIDEKTFIYGVPMMALATFLFIISGISRNIYRWEGMLFLLLYMLFMLKLFGDFLPIVV